MKILIAEDEPVSRLMLEKFLLQWDYEVESATDGDEAWWLLQREDAPKLAVLDWMMPGRDGLQLCREIRSRAGGPYVYIILLTAKAQKQDVINGLDAGADDYVTKPFDPEELKVRLRAGRRILDLQEGLLAAREGMQFPSTHDFLTGLWNREAILGILRREMSRPVQEGVGVILVNVDRFRYVPNTYGPAAGDTVLREVARRVRGAARRFDSIGRFGEKEFLIVLPGCDPSAALSQADRIRAAIAGAPYDILTDTIGVTSSLGVATSEEIQDPGALLQAVEMAVFRAKRGGRNRVELAVATGADDSPVARASARQGV